MGLSLCDPTTDMSTWITYLVVLVINTAVEARSIRCVDAWSTSGAHGKVYVWKYNVKSATTFCYVLFHPIAKHSMRIAH